MSSKEDEETEDEGEKEGQSVPPVKLPLPPPPAKGILKKISSIAAAETSHQGGASTSDGTGKKKKKKKKLSEGTKNAKFDEMNIIATLHPADKDYGFDSIDEPKTPYNLETGEDTSTSGKSLSADDLTSKLMNLGESKPTVVEKPLVKNSGGSSSSLTDEASEVSETDDDKSPEERRKQKREFEKHRRAHYDEFKVVRNLPAGRMDSDEEMDREENKKKTKKKK